MINKYIRITFSNACDLPDLYLSQGWQGEIFLDADINETEEDLFEEGDENGFGEFIPSYRRSMKRYVLRLGLMGLPTIEKLHKLRFFDNVELTTKTGEVQEIHRIDFNHDWQFDEKYFATGELRFDMSQVVEKKECCAAYVEPDQPENIVYGFLYNWYAVDDARGIAASGWSVPTDAEWTWLEDYIAAEIAAGRIVADGVGGPLKEEGTVYWVSPNEGATNELEFNGRGGGLRDQSGVFKFQNLSGYLWSVTINNATTAWYRRLSRLDADIQRNAFDKRNGMSIRPARPATATEKTTKSDGDACEPYEGNDGKVYRTVYIGENDTDNAMVWLADNLAETKYADLSDINSDDSLAGYWTFNEASGDALDYSGNANDGTLVGGVTRVAGKVGNGLEFDDNANVSIPSNPSLTAAKDGDVMTLCAWWQPYALGNSGTLFSLYANASNRFRVRTLNATELRFNGAWDGVGFADELAVTLSTTELSHIVWIIEGTLNTLYVNNVLIGTFNTTSNLSGILGNLGMQIGNFLTAEEAAGIIDEPRIYSRALTQAEITDLYNLRAVYGGISNANWAAKTTEALCAYDDDLDNV